MLFSSGLGPDTGLPQGYEQHGLLLAAGAVARHGHKLGHHKHECLKTTGSGLNRKGEGGEAKCVVLMQPAMVGFKQQLLDVGRTLNPKP